MSYVRIWVHAVFTTRDRYPYCSSEIRKKLFPHIRDNCRAKDIFLDSINGWSEHVHILLSLGREQNIANVMRLIKGESAHWLNRQGFFKGKFYWQDDYFAISVSESQVGAVHGYIERQEEHHKAVPFDREFLMLEKVVRGEAG
ncbi:MAG: IS200/IS605 family transposase [Pyrinomonadaceae bacterium]|nr:IS200/IS605 family transposase [Pyrinomonadaceae bacterium]